MTTDITYSHTPLTETSLTAPAARTRSATRTGTAPRTHRARLIALALAAVLSLPLIAAFALALEGWSAPAIAALALFTLNTVWVASAAAISLIGMLFKTPDLPQAPANWRPRQRTAILWLLCGEDPEPIRDAALRLRRALDLNGWGGACDIHILSDTRGEAARALEAELFAPGVVSGQLHYRNRPTPEGRKPGNIGEWLDRAGADYEMMMIFDADSRMSARRIGRMIHHMSSNPALGLLQSGMQLLPGRSRFGKLQRLSSRLAGPVFCNGLSAITGRTGNYWGHNALIRVQAFAAAARLPRLSGNAPFGGDVLSHDFIEAAWMRRAGWTVEIAPSGEGSFEDGPQTIAEFHRRDRRWCQGNLQHLRLIGDAGLHPMSRLHLAGGVQSYLSAPIWLALVLLIGGGAVPVTGVLPLAGALALLLIPKAVGLVLGMRRQPGPWRKGMILKAGLVELILSSLLAPLVMIRQCAAVASVLAGRDSGWSTGNLARIGALPTGVPEALGGLGIVATGIAMQGMEPALVWLAPVVFPLIAAPLLVGWFDHVEVDDARA